ncbi:MAG: hypothetical protein WDW38_003223 [Sanguina aurantia]
MDQYEKLEKVGEGTYGKVYKAKDINTGKLVALKKCRLEMEEEGVPSTTLREVSLLQMLSESNHVVKLLSVEHTEENNKPCLYLVFEYLSTDLKKWMDKTGKGPSNPLGKQVVKNLVYQLVKGLAHCHKHGVLHRDLKPQNLLVDDSNLCLKIADLGLGRHFSIPLKSYTHEAPLFPGDSELQQLLHIFKLLGTPTEENWQGVTKLRDWHEWPQWQAQDLTRIFPNLEPEGIELMQMMMEYDPARRISAKEALRHAYFDDLDKETVDQLENPDISNSRDC